jgi:hypothetical protein
MKKIGKIVLSVFAAVFLMSGNMMAEFKPDAIEKLKPAQNDLPENFVFGTIPGFAKKVLKNNPWTLDDPAMKKMIGRIYPGGDYQNVSKVHMSIFANKKNPYRDDFVCYIILYKNKNTAKKELEKLTSYNGYNSDRTILISRDNMAVFFLADDIVNYKYIQEMANSMQEKIKSL